MRVSRSEPGVVISSAAHAGLLLAALVLFSDTKKFEDAQEMIPVEVVTDSALNQVAKGEKTARDLKPSQRVDKVAPQSETKPEPPLAEAKKDTPTPPPSLKRLPDPGADDKPEPVPPKRIAALPPAPEPPTRPQPEKKPEPPKPVEAKPAPTPPAKPKAAAPQEKEREEPKDAEIVKPKPPLRPKPEPEKEAKETPKPEKPKERLKIDEVAKLLDSKKAEEKPAKPENSEGEAAEKNVKSAKPKSGDESAPKSKFDAASISKLLSKEAPQRRAATGEQIRTASLGAPEGSAPKMSASMEGRIAAYIHDHYHPCWASALTLGGQTFAPVVEFHLTREGALEGRPRLLNPSGNPVEQARGEQAVQAVRRCSPMRIPPEFMPYYEEALHDVTIRFQDAN